jgi:hypothetical protein
MMMTQAQRCFRQYLFETWEKNSWEIWIYLKVFCDAIPCPFWVAVARLSVWRYSKMWSWVQRESEPRMTVLARTSRNLPVPARQIPSRMVYGCNTFLYNVYNQLPINLGHAVAQLVETLCYKPEGRGFVSWWGHCFFNWPNPSSRTMALGSTQTLRQMGTRCLYGGKRWPGRKADKLSTICEATV